MAVMPEVSPIIPGESTLREQERERTRRCTYLAADHGDRLVQRQVERKRWLVLHGVRVGTTITSEEDVATLVHPARARGELTEWFEPIARHQGLFRQLSSRSLERRLTGIDRAGWHLKRLTARGIPVLAHEHHVAVFHDRHDLGKARRLDNRKGVAATLRRLDVVLLDADDVVVQHADAMHLPFGEPRVAHGVTVEQEINGYRADMRPALMVLVVAVVAIIGGSAILHVVQGGSASAGDDAAAAAAPASKAGGTAVVKPVKDVPQLSLPDPLPNRTLHVPILMYHRIAVLNGDEPRVTVGLTVDPGEFQLQMAWLHDHDFHTITQLQLFQALEEGKPLPSKPILLSFDDGYRGIATVAAPIMSQFGYYGTAYVITDRIAESRKTAPTWLTWPQLRILEQRGWDIGSHTVSHTEIPHMSADAAMKTLRQSRFALERHLGHPVQWFCYPAGSVNQAAVDEVRKAGYVLATTTKEGDTLSAQDPLQLERIRISNTTGVRGLAAALS